MSKAPSVETIEVTPASISEYVVEGSVFVRQDNSFRVRSITVQGGKAMVELEVIDPHEEMRRDRRRFLASKNGK